VLDATTLPQSPLSVYSSRTQLGQWSVQLPYQLFAIANIQDCNEAQIHRT
jgi:hypothetical protein